MKPVANFGKFFLDAGLKLRHNHAGPQDFEIGALQLVTCFPTGSKERMKIRWVKKSVDDENFAPQFGQGHGEALIASGEVPEEWKPFYILLPGTVWGNKNQRSHISSMYFNLRVEEWRIGLASFSDHITLEGRFSNFRLIDFVR